MFSHPPCIVDFPKIVLLVYLCGWWPVNQAVAQDHSAGLSQQVRSILSNRCFACHGPDEAERQAGFRLDQRDSMLAEADSGLRPIIPGDAQQSELLRRIMSDDEDERMPPSDFSKPLGEAEVQAIEDWITQGAKLPEHWSFVAPVRPPLPETSTRDAPGEATSADWSSHPVDRFVRLQQMRHGMQPSPQATRAELLRRLSLDLIGLPPTIDEVHRFEQDAASDAYERQVDRLLGSPAYGEHWARKWLDLARYADSAGYADDPSRTIWAYRDWVIDALNDNMPIDQFTIEQLAGDLLPNPTQEQLVATAFNRNTLTNNEGGTNDEEFRSVAIVDRVNTTMAVWMGVTMACAQCHTHKFDPFTQEEYFKLYAIFNQSQDADLVDESPVLELYTSEQRYQQRQMSDRAEQLVSQLSEPTQEALAGFAQWQSTIAEPEWTALVPQSCETQRDSDVRFEADQSIQVRPTANNIVADTYTLRLRSDSSQSQQVHALGLRTIPNGELPGGGAGTSATGGNFVVTGLTASVTAEHPRTSGVKFVRIDLPGQDKILSLAEVQAFAGDINVALNAQARQSSTAFQGKAARAVDGETDGDYTRDSTTHTGKENDPWWECELNEPQAVDRVVLWNRTDGNLAQRLNGARLQLLDADRKPLFEHTFTVAPKVSDSLTTNPRRVIRFLAARADYEQTGFPASNIIDADGASGWAVGGAVASSHLLTLIPEQPFELEPSAILELQIEHGSSHRHHLLGSFRVETSLSQSASQWSQLDDELIATLALPEAERSSTQLKRLEQFYCRNIAPENAAARTELTVLQTQLADMKPDTSVPVMRELGESSRRETFIQIRGNYKSLGAKVEPGVPAIFHPLRGKSETSDASAATAKAVRASAEGNLISTTSSSKLPVDRLAFAQWLVDRRNPLTARVWVNRMWESLFGLGLVRTSEDFGAQGDMPTHPELLDWLACELMDGQWDTKRLLRLLVTSQTYRQTSRVTHDAWQEDQDNEWLSRGPRVRLSAEMVRDQALAIGGLLSHKMHGAPVRPPQPNLGLKAAFGSDTDWQTSAGEDRYRRGLYTTWRRSNPYPSMATFDAPSREVCILRRDSTNTPLQALVTLNDPAFVEAAQALARRVVLVEMDRASDDSTRLQSAFELCTSRAATEAELQSLLGLLDTARQHFADEPAAAKQLSSDPLGPLDSPAQEIELAAWTSVCNVLLNLDEVLMKR
jgi:mono/diheme cytochrome c family protein